MENFQDSSSSQSAAFLPHNHGGDIDAHEDIQMRTLVRSIKFSEPEACIDDDARAAIIFDAISTERPHDYGLLGAASSGPVTQLDQTPEGFSSLAVTQCWQKYLANIGDPAQNQLCNSRAMLTNSRNPFLQPTWSHGLKQAAGRRSLEGSRKCIGNGMVHKLIERERRNKMKTLCSTLISLLPEEYCKRKHPLSDNLMESVKYISHLQDKIIQLGKKRDELSLLATVKPFSKNCCVYKNLQVPEMFQTIRVSKFGSCVQVTANTFKKQNDFSCLLTVLEEAGLEVVSAALSAINDGVFYSIHSKLSNFRHFDSAVLHGTIEKLMNGILPSDSTVL